MDKILKPKDLAARWHITVRTLQTWDRTGKFVACRYPSGRRFYRLEDVLNFENQKGRK